MASAMATHRLALFFFIVLTAAATWPQIRRLDRSVADHPDAQLSVWRLAWVAHQLPRDPAHLFDANIFYPEKRTLAYSDAMLLEGILGAPLIWMRVHPLVVYNLSLLAGFALSGFATFLLVRELTGRAGPALVAGAIFALAPYRFAHYFHLELQWTMWMPLALLWLRRTFEHRWFGDGVMTGAMLALQTLSSIYYGIFLATTLVVIGLALFLAGLKPGATGSRQDPVLFLAGLKPGATGSRQDPVLFLAGLEPGATDSRQDPVAPAFRPAMRRAVLGLVAGLLVCVVAIAPYALPYLQNRQTVGERSRGEVDMFSARPANYLAAPAHNAVYGRWLARFGDDNGERFLFPGFATVALATAGAWPPLTAFRAGAVVAAALAFDQSLGPRGLTFPILRRAGPLYRGLRAPARLGIVVGLLLAVLAGLGVARLTEGLPTRGRAAACAGLVLVAIVEAWSAPLELRDVPAQPPDAYSLFAQQQPPPVLVEYPLPALDNLGVTDDADYMYYSIFHWARLVNGYSGFYPQSYARLIIHTATFPDPAAVGYLRDRGVNYVVLHRARLGAARYLDWRQRLTARDDIGLALVGRRGQEEVAIYELR